MTSIYRPRTQELRWFPSARAASSEPFILQRLAWRQSVGYGSSLGSRSSWSSQSRGASASAGKPRTLFQASIRSPAITSLLRKHSWLPPKSCRCCSLREFAHLPSEKRCAVQSDVASPKVNPLLDPHAGCIRHRGRSLTTSRRYTHEHTAFRRTLALVVHHSDFDSLAVAG